MTKDQIRQIFLAAGFTIKEGETDLKDYVYQAAGDVINEMLNISYSTISMMTRRKSADIIQQGYSIVGYVLQDTEEGSNKYAISSHGAVRWLDNAEVWKLMHPSNDLESLPVPVPPIAPWGYARSYRAGKLGECWELCAAEDGTITLYALPPSNPPSAHKLAMDAACYEIQELQKAFNLLEKILDGDVGRQYLNKLDKGTSTDTDDGRNWLAAYKLVKSAS